MTYAERMSKGAQFPEFSLGHVGEGKGGSGREGGKGGGRGERRKKESQGEGWGRGLGKEEWRN